MRSNEYTTVEILKKQKIKLRKRALKAGRSATKQLEVELTVIEANN